jgi:hypothetical protein
MFTVDAKVQYVVTIYSESIFFLIILLPSLSTQSANMLFGAPNNKSPCFVRTKFSYTVKESCTQDN